MQMCPGPGCTGYATSRTVYQRIKPINDLLRHSQALVLLHIARLPIGFNHPCPQFLNASKMSPLSPLFWFWGLVFTTFPNCNSLRLIIIYTLPQSAA